MKPPSHTSAENWMRHTIIRNQLEQREMTRITGTCDEITIPDHAGTMPAALGAGWGNLAQIVSFVFWWWGSWHSGAGRGARRSSQSRFRHGPLSPPAFP